MTARREQATGIFLPASLKSGEGPGKEYLNVNELYQIVRFISLKDLMISSSRLENARSMKCY